MEFPKIEVLPKPLDVVKAIGHGILRLFDTHCLATHGDNFAKDDWGRVPFGEEYTPEPVKEGWTSLNQRYPHTFYPNPKN